MMKMTGLSHLFKWENLHNWWLTKYFFAPLYISRFFSCKSYSSIKDNIIISTVSLSSSKICVYKNFPAEVSRLCYEVIFVTVCSGRTYY